MSSVPVASTLVLCVGLPLHEVAALAGAVRRGTLVLAAGDAEAAWKLLRSPAGVAAGEGEHVSGGAGVVAGSSGVFASEAPAERDASVQRVDRGERGAVEPTGRSGPLRVGRLVIDGRSREVLSGDEAVHMSAREFDLLMLLASDPHRAWTFATLVEAVWHTDYLGDHDQLASTVKRLRKRLGRDAGCVVHSVHGVGYRLVVTKPAVA